MRPDYAQERDRILDEATAAHEMRRAAHQVYLAAQNLLYAEGLVGWFEIGDEVRIYHRYKDGYDVNPTLVIPAAVLLRMCERLAPQRLHDEPHVADGVPEEREREPGI